MGVKSIILKNRNIQTIIWLFKFQTLTTNLIFQIEREMLYSTKPVRLDFCVKWFRQNVSFCASPVSRTKKILKSSHNLSKNGDFKYFHCSSGSSMNLNSFNFATFTKNRFWLFSWIFLSVAIENRFWETLLIHSKHSNQKRSKKLPKNPELFENVLSLQRP